MPLVRVEIWSGRTPEVKMQLAEAITNAVVEHIGCTAQGVTVIIDEVPKENWVIGGKTCKELFPNVP